MQGKQLPGAWGGQHVPLGVPSCAPSPAQADWALMGAVPTSSSSSPILTEKGSTAEKRRLRARQPETGRPGPEPQGRAWKDVDAVRHPSVRHFVLTGHRAQELPLLREESSDPGLALPQVLLPALTSPGQGCSPPGAPSPSREDSRLRTASEGDSHRWSPRLTEPGAMPGGLCSSQCPLRTPAHQQPWARPGPGPPSHCGTEEPSFPAQPVPPGPLGALCYHTLGAQPRDHCSLEPRFIFLGAPPRPASPFPAAREGLGIPGGQVCPEE